MGRSDFGNFSVTRPQVLHFLGVALLRSSSSSIGSRSRQRGKGENTTSSVQIPSFNLEPVFFRTVSVAGAPRLQLFERHTATHGHVVVVVVVSLPVVFPFGHGSCHVTSWVILKSTFFVSVDEATQQLNRCILLENVLT